MITMTCCINSEQISLGNLSKEGRECKSEKKINVRHSNKHLQNKWNSARFRFQKILAPNSIKCVAKYWLSQRGRSDLIHNMVITSNRISCMSMYWATTTNQSNQTEKKKALFTLAPLNHMHKGHCSYLTILKMAAVSSTIILPLPQN